jgi:Ca2+-transporting ATPase
MVATQMPGERVLGGTLLALTAITTVPVLAQAFGFAALLPLHWLAALATRLALLLPLQLAKGWAGALRRDS